MKGLNIATAVIAAIWLTLLLMGKGGFVHLILLCALGFGSVALMAEIRGRMTEN